MSSSYYLCLLLLMSFLQFCLSIQNFNHVLCKDVERRALLQFKQGLIINWANKLASWVGEEKECCSWAGIVCDNHTGHVHQIHLRDFDGYGDCQDVYSVETNKHKLGRDLSPSILQLKQLRHLDLSCNDFEGIQVPSFLGSLRNLRYLNLSNSRFVGIIPPQLGNLSELQVLGLKGFMDDGCHLSMLNMQWLSSLHMLRHLDMSGVDLSEATDWLQFLHISENDFRNSSLVLGNNLVSLEISSSGISSSFLDSLHNLTSLFSLDLSDNELTKAIPKSLGNLCNLREIDLSSNKFHNISLAYLLESFFECKSPSLESLFLQSSGISGHLPDQLGQLIHLVHLNLGLNSFVGVIPDSIGQLSCLKFLYLYDNLVFGPIPYSIGGLSSLETLDLSHNQLNGSLPDSLGQLLKLDKLDLSYNQLTGNVPSSLGQLSKLNSLDLSSNLLTGVVTEAHFAKLTGLKQLNGTGNSLILRPQLANWIPPFQLQSLYLRSWDLGPQFPLWLQLQRDLLELDMSNTNISAPMPESFLSSFPNLYRLDMSQNHIQGTLFSIPATFSMLDLSSNEFTGQLPYISSGSGTRVLDLSNNFFGGSLHPLLCPYDEKLSGRLPASLMNLTNLRFLQLGRNELVGSIPTWFGRELSDLRSLDLRSNNFDGNIPQELCYLTKIRILDLADNNLSGNIPRCFNNFSVLSGKESGLNDAYIIYSNSTKQYIISESVVMKGREDVYNTILGLVSMMDLSSNNFVGHIPGELTALRKLKSLNLSRNQLTGRIPEKIGDLKSLDSFDLSLNKLSGELPMSLSSLSFLSSFNVSYNSFTGRIPSSTQLQSFNESSFFGNNLCGDPLTESCVVEVHDRDHKEEEKEDGSHGADWGLIISTVFGFVAGFWIIVAPLIVIRSWRIAYFRFLTGLGYMAYDFIHKYCCNMFFK
ncbi:hypothetical protein L6452_12416 [Arctium lappa]|uniref:Uncharacterized protein n=1 Tax=Arctium lappa TaxID=4217 RepID=A0ACB9DRK8_ARCLA|nr:hypothetical protein L6452_12416 [Arctium lappa]